jgi:hypothetical protein
LEDKELARVMEQELDHKRMEWLAMTVGVFIKQSEVYFHLIRDKLEKEKQSGHINRRRMTNVVSSFLNNERKRRSSFSKSGISSIVHLLKLNTKEASFDSP